MHHVGFRIYHNHITVIIRIGDILVGAYPSWKHVIIRDCSRYLQIAIKELSYVGETYRLLENGIK